MGQPAAILDAPSPTESADSVEPFTVTAPRSALASIPTTAVQLTASEGTRDGNKFTFSTPIRTTTVLEHWLWGRLVHDFAGVSLQAERQPLNWSHFDSRDDDIVGYFESVRTEGSELWADVTLVSTQENDTADTITKKMDSGVPYWFSIEFPLIESDDWEIETVDDGETAEVNGETLDGPLLIFRSWPLRGLAICRQGYDPNASAQLAAGSTDQLTLTLPGELGMLFKSQRGKASTELAGRKAAPATPANDDAGNTTPPAAGDDAGTDPPANDDAGTTTAGDGENTQAPEPPTSVSEGGGSVSLSFEPTGDPMKDAVKLAAVYAERYGENGAKYLAEELSFDEANARELAELRKKNAELESKVAQLGKAHAGETEPLGSGSAPGKGDSSKPDGANLTLAEMHEKQFGGGE